MSPLIVDHPLYTKTVASLERTAFRDKLLRLVQYFSRFLSFYTFRKGYSANVVAQLKALTSALSLSRKAFRFLKPLGAFRIVANEISNHTTPSVKHFTTIGKNLGMGLYLCFDILAFLQLTGSYKFKPATFKTITENANRFWLLSLVSGIIDAGYGFYVESQRIKALSLDEKSSEAEIKKANEARNKQAHLLAWNAIDALIPSSSLGYINGNDGLVGLAGTVTAYFGLKDIWTSK